MSDGYITSTRTARGASELLVGIRAEPQTLIPELRLNSNKPLFFLNFTCLFTVYLTGYALIMGLYMERFILLIVKKYINHKWQDTLLPNKKKS